MSHQAKALLCLPLEQRHQVGFEPVLGGDDETGERRRPHPGLEHERSLFLEMSGQVLAAEPQGLGAPRGRSLSRRRAACTSAESS
jgi:hypothetical protein